jgi:hypothetical protein
MNNAASQLKSLSGLKHDARFTTRSADFRVSQEAALLSAIGARNTSVAAAPATYSFADYLSYFKATQIPTLTKSFAGALAVIALLFGGSLGTVNAAGNSLPGDALYGFKLVTEQVQLRFASLQGRAVLHTEFAGRRLAEASALQQVAPNNPEQSTNVKAAVNAFKQEIASANADLQQLAKSGDASALQTASTVAAQITAFNTSLTAAATDNSEDASVKIEVADAKDVTRETQTTAVAVVVETHEADATTTSTRDMSNLFQQQLGDLRGRQTFDLHRITVVQAAIAKMADQLAGVTVPSNDDFKATTYSIKKVDAAITNAMNLFAQSAFRAAFDQLHSVDSELLQVEAKLAEVENLIVNPSPVMEGLGEALQPEE